MTSGARLTAASAFATALAAMALLPTFEGFGWIARTVGAVLVVAVVAGSARALGLPRALAPVCALAGLAVYVTVVFVHQHALLGFIPAGDARLALDLLVDQGWHDISELRAPVPTSTGLVLLTTCGVGLLAVVVDVLAVTLRKAALAGLPLLALFAVSAGTVPDGVGWLPFVYGGIGYLTLLLTDSMERVSRWGRPLGAGRRPAEGPAMTAERAETAPLLQVGRRVGFAALGVAVVVPALVPGLHPGLFGTQGGDGPGIGSGGSSTVTTYNPITQIKRQLINQRNTPLFRYLSNAPDPTYFRMTALDRFDGTGWSQGDLSAPASNRVSNGLPPPKDVSDRVPRTEVLTQVAASDRFSVPWLPLPYPAGFVVVDGDWRWEEVSRAVFSTRTTTRGLRWEATHFELAPTRAQLRTATTGGDEDVIENLALDPAVPQLLLDEARAVTAGAQSPFERALALQRHFRSTGGYSYSVNVQDDGSGTEAMLAFLTDRRGYCVQFASTMALMARAVGIPARVAIGFTPGQPQEDDSYLVTGQDAHTWPELFFEGMGWLAFEPTPTGDGRARPPSYTREGNGSDAGGPGEGGRNRPEPEPTASAPGAGVPSAAPGVRGGSNPTVTLQDQDGGGLPIAVYAGLLVLGLVAAAPGTTRWVVRRRRWTAAETPAARAHVAWRELGDDARDLGVRWRVDDSPRRAAERLAATTGLTESLPALRRLAWAEERACYAPDLASADGTDQLAADERAVRHELARRGSRPRRWAARLVPRSTIESGFHALTGLVADGLDLLDRAMAWTYRLLVPARLRRS